MFFAVTETRDGTRRVLSIVGDLDLSALPEVANRVALSDGDELIIDLSSVDHFDPLCFGVLISAQLRFKRSGRRFAVLSPDGRPRALLEESGLDRVLEIIDSLDDSGEVD